MVDGRLEVPGAVVPGAGPAMQPGDVSGALVEQARVQDVGEQVVVAVPAAVVVEGHDEQVLSFQGRQGRPPVRTAGDGIAQRSGHPVEHRRLEQEPPQVVGLAVEDLVGEVVHDEPVVAREALDEPGGVVSALQ